jgi:hypothetical protein
MLEVVPLPNTDRLQQIEDYVRGCTTSVEGGQCLVEVVQSLTQSSTC